MPLWHLLYQGDGIQYPRCRCSQRTSDILFPFLHFPRLRRNAKLTTDPNPPSYLCCIFLRVACITLSSSLLSYSKDPSPTPPKALPLAEIRIRTYRLILTTHSDERPSLSTSSRQHELRTPTTLSFGPGPRHSVHAKLAPAVRENDAAMGRRTFHSLAPVGSSILHCAE